MIDRAFAEQFAAEWIATWNSHDLDRVLAHYSDDFEMSSPFIVELMGEPSGKLKGKNAIRPYWTKALAASPPLRFELERVFSSVDSVAIAYRRAGTGRQAIEVLFFNASGKVICGVAHYSN